MIMRYQKFSIKGISALSYQLLILYLLFSLGNSTVITENNQTGDACLSEVGAYLCDEDKCPCHYPESYRTFALYFELVCATLGLIASLVNIIGSISVKELREPPGDIFLGFSLGAAVICSSWIAQLHVLISNDSTLKSEDDFCINMAYIDVFCSTIIHAYNYSFFIFFYVLTRTSLKIKSIPQSFYHIAAIGGSFIFFGVVNLFPQVIAPVEESRDLFGLSAYGQCTFKTTNSIFIAAVASVLTLLLPIFLYYATAKSLPKCRAISKARYHFLKDYLKYVYCTSIVSFLLDIISIYIGKTLTELPENIKNENFFSFAMRLLNTLLRISRPGLLTLIRLMDPKLRQYWQRTFFWAICCCCCKKRKAINESEVNLNGEVQKEDLDGRKKMISMTVRAVHKHLRNSPYLYQIQHAVRVQVLYSLLSSIHCFWSINNKFAPENHILVDHGDDYEKKAKISERIEINDEVLKRELPQMMREIRQKNYKLIDGRLIAHAPALFSELVKLDIEPEKLAISLDLSANYNRILNAGHSKGGRSGEFFFFSYDENLVIKTISDKELRTLLEIMPNYVRHFQENPHSFIAKIYGVFTFERMDPYEKYNLILMRNVSGFPSKCVERKYDLKGSTYTRATVESGNPQLHELKYFDQILKDLDFNRFEGKMHIENHMKENVLEILKKDTDFLSENELIDYSLVVYLIDKTNTEQHLTTITSNKPVKDSSQSSTDELRRSLNLNENRSIEAGSYNYSPMFRSDFALRESIQGPGIQVKGEGRKTGTSTNSQEPKPISRENFNSMRSTRNDEIIHYHIGIIDYLIKYTWKKRLEKFWKKLVSCNPNLDISVQHPEYYARRFMNYMRKIIP